MSDFSKSGASDERRHQFGRQQLQGGVGGVADLGVGVRRQNHQDTQLFEGERRHRALGREQLHVMSAFTAPEEIQQQTTEASGHY